MSSDNRHVGIRVRTIYGLQEMNGCAPDVGYYSD